MEKKLIANTEFGGERPLFAEHDLLLENVVIHAGESALKQCRNIAAFECTFEGKYPFWHVDNFNIEKCLFTPGARAALWYSSNLVMKYTLVQAPKMFLEMQHIVLDNVRIPDAQETLWHCDDVKIKNVEVKNADYLFMHSNDIEIEDYKQEGNYSFQYCRNVTIKNAIIHSKDAFWNTENVTVYDSELIGEYLGWHSKNLRLVNCKIGGTQPLCYCENLIMENCEFEADADLAFEDSSVNADIKGDITSVKNPRHGYIKVGKIHDLILDKNILAPADCIIETTEK